MKSTFGQQTIANLKEFLADVKAGKPIHQSIVRRMTVKDKTAGTVSAVVREEAAAGDIAGSRC